MLGRAASAGAPGGGGGGDDDGGDEIGDGEIGDGEIGDGDPVGTNGGDRVVVVVGVVDPLTGDDGAGGFLSFTHRWTRV